jgi:hypothetical protein
LNEPFQRLNVRVARRQLRPGRRQSALRVVQLPYRELARGRGGRWGFLRCRHFTVRSFRQRTAVGFLRPGVFGELLHFFALDDVPVGREPQFGLDRA